MVESVRVDLGQRKEPLGNIGKILGGQCRTRTCDLLLVRQAL